MLHCRGAKMHQLQFIGDRDECDSDGILWIHLGERLCVVYDRYKNSEESR